MRGSWVALLVILVLVSQLGHQNVFGEQGNWQNSVTLANNAVVRLDIAYPKTAQKGQFFTIDTYVTHVLPSETASDFSVRFVPEPEPMIRIAEPENLIRFGDVAAGVKLYRGFRFLVSLDAPDDQLLKIRIQANDTFGPVKSLGPDLEIRVSRTYVPPPPTPPPQPSFDWIYIVFVSVIGIVAVAALLLLTRRRQPPPTPPTPVVYGPPKPTSPTALHRPQVVEVRKKEG